MKKWFLFGFGYFFAMQGCIRLIEIIQTIEIDKEIKRSKLEV